MVLFILENNIKKEAIQHEIKLMENIIEPKELVEIINNTSKRYEWNDKDYILMIKN